MTKKKQYPGGVKLTAKTARALAIQEFGTARGLTKSTSFVGVYFMEFGNLRTTPTVNFAVCIPRRNSPRLHRPRPPTSSITALTATT